MEETEKFKANKKSNAPFLRALDVLMKEKKINQTRAAELLATKSGTFSDYKNGKKKAGQEMFNRIARAFDGRLNIRFLTGESEYMMLANVPDEEILEYSQRDENPDFDVQKKAKAAEHATEDASSYLLELYAQRIRLVDDLRHSLKEELAEVRAIKEDMHQAVYDFRNATYRLTQALQKLENNQPRQLDLAAES